MMSDDVRPPPPALVDPNQIAQNWIYYLPAVSTRFCNGMDRFFFLFFAVFQAKPPTPPSAAQEATLAPLESSPFLHSIKRLFLNLNYILLLISYGMNVGVFYAISTLLNRVSTQRAGIISVHRIKINTNESARESGGGRFKSNSVISIDCDVDRSCCCTIRITKWMLDALVCALCWPAWWAPCAVASFWIKRTVSSKSIQNTLSIRQRKNSNFILFASFDEEGSKHHVLRIQLLLAFD